MCVGVELWLLWRESTQLCHCQPPGDMDSPTNASVGLPEPPEQFKKSLKSTSWFLLKIRRLALADVSRKKNQEKSPPPAVQSWELYCCLSPASFPPKGQCFPGRWVMTHLFENHWWNTLMACKHPAGTTVVHFYATAWTLTLVKNLLANWRCEMIWSEDLFWPSTHLQSAGLS